jgi:hypothetical protein
MHKIWIQYHDLVIALQNIAYIKFLPAHEEEAWSGEAAKTGERIKHQARLLINFVGGESFALQGQEAEDVWAIFQTQSLNLSRKAE